MKITTILFFIYLSCSYTLKAQITEIPDPIFEQYLIDFGFDSDGIVNGQILTDDINWRDFIEINHIPPQYDIQDFTGIQDFASLETFIAGFTSISFLNMGDLENLTFIEIVGHPNLTNIDLSGLSNLEILSISGTDINSIELPPSPVLHTFSMTSNSLETLDLSQYSNLTDVVLSNNDLTSLDVANGNNTNITFFSTSSNPNLECILVDDIAYSEENWTSIEPLTVFVDEIKDCPALLSVAQPTLTEISVFPNPAKDYFQVSANLFVSNINIYDVNGKMVKNFNQAQDIYLLEDLTDGFYLMGIKTDTNSLVKKLIIKQ